MTDRLIPDDEVLARLLQDAGNPNMAPEPGYAEKLRATILDRLDAAESGATAGLSSSAKPVGGDSVADRTVGCHQSARESPPTISNGPTPFAQKRTPTMKRIVRLAVAASILVAAGIAIFWLTLGGSTSIALADVAHALGRLRTVTYDFTSEGKNPIDGVAPTTKSRGYFLAPSHERSELLTSTDDAKDTVGCVMILDCLAAEGLVLDPARKRAVAMHMAVPEKDRSTGGTAQMFGLIRQIVAEKNVDAAEKVELLGEKEIDGRRAVGFRRRTNSGDQTLWADPETAQLIRVDADMANVRCVMNNFRYNVELDPSLFSLEPPAGYTVENRDVAMPTEEDLVGNLRFVAEHNGGVFPAAIGFGSEEFTKALQAELIAEPQKLLETPEVQERMAEVMAQHAGDKAAGTKAWMNEWKKMTEPITQKIMQKRMQGVIFYGELTPENDSHYVGGGVKLGTPDRPILWYKPTGSERYRVIYADLSVKEATPDEVKGFPQTPEKSPAPTTDIPLPTSSEKGLIEMLRFYAAGQNGMLPPTLSIDDVESGIRAPLEEEIKAKYGSSSRESKTKAMQDPEFMKKIMDSGLRLLPGMEFLRGLTSENDLHYAGKDVKLDTPDRPILRYKPTGAENYRVVYADLGVKDMTPDEVKKLPNE